MEIKSLKIEIRKHHVTPGVNVLDLLIETDEEKIIKQTQHKDTDKAFQDFASEAVRIAKDLANARIE
ncbi:MAG: hypothetical protein ACE5G9_11165 [Nitrospinales bacterium]